MFLQNFLLPVACNLLAASILEAKKYSLSWPVVTVVAIVVSGAITWLTFDEFRKPRKQGREAKPVRSGWLVFLLVFFAGLIGGLIGTAVAGNLYSPTNTAFVWPAIILIPFFTAIVVFITFYLVVPIAPRPTPKRRLYLYIGFLALGSLTLWSYWQTYDVTITTPTYGLHVGPSFDVIGQAGWSFTDPYISVVLHNQSAAEPLWVVCDQTLLSRNGQWSATCRMPIVPDYADKLQVYAIRSPHPAQYSPGKRFQFAPDGGGRSDAVNFEFRTK